MAEYTLTPTEVSVLLLVLDRFEGKPEDFYQVELRTLLEVQAKLSGYFTQIQEEGGIKP